MSISKDFTKEGIKSLRRVYTPHLTRVKNKIACLLTRAIGVTLVILCFSAGGAAFGAYAGVINNSPKLEEFDPRIMQGNFTTIIYSEYTDEELDRWDAGENREFVDIEDVSPYLRDAFVAIEDERFYQHDGVDIHGLFRAVYVNLFSEDKQGASTITQQLIKNKLNIRRNTWDTKLQEQHAAIEYEKDLTDKLGSKEAAKAYILEQYLNEVGLGEGQKGVKAASMHYFNEEPMNLTLAESAVLAAITQNPTMRSPVNHPDQNRERAAATLDIMLRLGFITDGERDSAAAELDGVYPGIAEIKRESLETPSMHSYYNDAITEQVIGDLEKKYGWSRKEASDYYFSGGLKIYSAQDLETQDILDRAFLDESMFPKNEFEIAVDYYLTVRDTLTGDVENHHESSDPTIKDNEFGRKITSADGVERFENDVKDAYLGQYGEVVSETTYAIPQPQAAMVVVDYRTGYVKALVGGRGEKVTNRSLNRATQALRQPGSVFKVLASYAPAIDLGRITPATVLIDEPYVYDAPGIHYEPHNWYKNPTYRGRANVRLGITDSMNVITVKNMVDTGIENCYNKLLQFGFTTLVPDDMVPAACLGGITNGVKQIEMAAAYGAIANKGLYNTPKLYTKVLDHDGHVILENEIAPERILEESTAYLLTDMMEDVVTKGTGKNSQFRNLDMPIAGKTGTTTSQKDLCFVGYTPYYVGSIWLGYDMPKEMTAEADGVQQRLWSRVMEEIHTAQGLEKRDFWETRPDTIIERAVCRDSGKVPGPFCSSDPRGSRVYTEIFAKSNAPDPKQQCDYHTSEGRLRDFDICVDSGKIPTEYCPAESVKHMTGYADGSSDGQFEAVPPAILLGLTCDIHPPHTETPTPDNPTPLTGDPTADPGPDATSDPGTAPPDQETPPYVAEPSVL
ncbi:MAG: transglycosylase domain-containing protein [Clostridiales bacterium]|jgi:penicillin-binding protein 1A|nr:transglycosylase domain-containing protein [Clostridiales bacterium]